MTVPGRGPSTLGAGLVIVAACLALGGLGAVEARHVSVTHGYPLAWPVLFWSTMPRWLLLAVVLPFVFWLGVVRPLAPPRPAILLGHGALLAVLSMGHAVVDTWSTAVATPMVVSLFPLAARVTRSWYHTMPTVFSAYLAVVGAAWGLTEMWERRRRAIQASRLEAQLETARLTALRAQLQPHFLYNTLHGIAALVGDARPDHAIAAIEQLSELLHATLRDDPRAVVSVEEEVALAERYLALQQMRFGERLRYRLEVAPNANRCAVPILVLQPIVENAVIHGLEAATEPVRVLIRATATDDDLILTVENDGPAPSSTPGHRRGHGLGLSATRARLETAYGDSASLTIGGRDGGGAVVRIVVPRSEVPVEHRPMPAAMAAT